MLALPLSAFYSVRGNLPDATSADWPADFMRPWAAEHPDEKLNVPAFIPGVFRAGKGRASGGETLANLEGMSAIVLDYDADPVVAPETVDAALAAFDRIFYSTYRHTPAAPRFRVVLRLAAPVPVATWERARAALHAHLAANGAPVKPLPAGQVYFFHTVQPSIRGFARHGAGAPLDAAEWAARSPTRSSPPSLPPVTPSTSTSLAPASPPGGGIWSGIAETPEKLERIEAKCAFARRARADAATLPEPEWRAWLSIVSRCHDGRELAHQIGSAHPGYTRESTDAKLARLDTEISGPLTCAEIRRLSPACEGCPLGAPVGATATPLQLGRPDPVETPPEQYAAETAATRAATLDAARAAHEAAQTDLETAMARLSAARERRSHARRFHLGEVAAVEAAAAVTAAQRAVETAKSQLAREKKRLDAAERDQRRAQQIASAGGALNVAAQLAVGPSGTPYGSRSNIETILDFDPAFADIRYDAFSERVLYGDQEAGEADGAKASDIERRYTIADVRLQTYREALLTIARRREYHPVRDYLDGLTWDGVPRLNLLMRTGFGGRGDPRYLEMVGVKLCLSAVGRIYEPGCKCDEVVILTGREGARKSTGLRALSNGWFSDAHIDMANKDGLMAIAGVWIYELGELDSVNRAEQGTVKRFITTQVDRYRPPYAANMRDRPRQGILVGTTNEGEFLGRDGHGDRRFVPVPTDEVYVEWIEDYRDQLWAEAKSLYVQGERWHYTPDDYALLRAAQEAHRMEHPWRSQIIKYLYDGEREQFDLVDPREILTHPTGLNKPPHQIKHGDLAEIGKVLKTLGCELYHPPPRDGIRPPRVYRLPEAFRAPKSSAGRAPPATGPRAALPGQKLAHPGITVPHEPYGF